MKMGSFSGNFWREKVEQRLCLSEFGGVFEMGSFGNFLFLKAILTTDPPSWDFRLRGTSARQGLGINNFFLRFDLV